MFLLATKEEVIGFAAIVLGLVLAIGWKLLF